MMNGAAVLRHFHAFQPFRKTLDYVFLKEARLIDPAMKTLHRDRAIAHVRQHDGCNRFIVSGHLTFSDAVRGK